MPDRRERKQTDQDLNPSEVPNPATRDRAQRYPNPSNSVVITSVLQVLRTILKLFECAPLNDLDGLIYATSCRLHGKDISLRGVAYGDEVGQFRSRRWRRSRRLFAHWNRSKNARAFGELSPDPHFSGHCRCARGHRGYCIRDHRSSKTEF